MVASSFQAAKDLARLCELRGDASRAKNGVLFGKGEVEALQRDEQLSVKDYFRNVPGFGEAPDMATVYVEQYIILEMVLLFHRRTKSLLPRSLSFIRSL